MNGVELLGLLFGQLDAALADDAQAGAFDDGVDGARQIAARGVGLDDREGAFGHGSDFLFGSLRVGGL
ncbi:hypothetical protein D3C77_709180 [compost metagenome]